MWVTLRMRSWARVGRGHASDVHHLIVHFVGGHVVEQLEEAARQVVRVAPHGDDDAGVKAGLGIIGMRLCSMAAVISA